MKKFFTTTEAAGICGVAHTTVIRWIAEGKLRAHETPGGHRRIEKEDLAAFLKRFNMPAPDSLGGGPFRVLVVDDDKRMLSMIGKLFTEHLRGVELHTAERGMAALLLLGKARFDLVVLDVIMPDMDGIEVCRALGRDPATADIRIIAMTGKQLTEDQEAYLQRNTEGLLKKPFAPDALLARVDAIRKREEREL